MGELKLDDNCVQSVGIRLSRSLELLPFLPSAAYSKWDNEDEMLQIEKEVSPSVPFLFFPQPSNENRDGTGFGCAGVPGGRGNEGDLLQALRHPRGDERAGYLGLFLLTQYE